MKFLTFLNVILNEILNFERKLRPFFKENLTLKNPIFRDGIEYFGMGFIFRDGIEFLKIPGWDAKNSGISGMGWDGIGMGFNTSFKPFINPYLSKGINLVCRA